LKIIFEGVREVAARYSRPAHRSNRVTSTSTRSRRLLLGQARGAAL
jgi:hypothetical protein